MRLLTSGVKIKSLSWLKVGRQAVMFDVTIYATKRPQLLGRFFGKLTDIGFYPFLSY